MSIKNQSLGLDEWRRGLSYDPASGDFTWLIRPAIGVAAGDRAGSVDSNGYVLIRFKGVSCKAHRLAWLMTHGEWPKGQIDHKNTNRSDNRINNLREASGGQNQHNCRIYKSNSTGFKGVTKFAGKFKATIQVDRKHIHLGMFPDAAQAYAAYCAASARLHGEFSRVA